MSRFKQLLEDDIKNSSVVSEFLIESLESVIKSNPHIDPEIIKKYHKDALPINNKADKLLNHVLKMHKNGLITPENTSEWQKHLTILNNSNQMNKLRDVDSLDTLKSITAGKENKALTKKEAVDKDTPIVFENDDIVVKQHLTHASAVKGARLNADNRQYLNTKEPGKAQWCLSVDNDQGKRHYDSYTENGKNPLYTVFNKKTNSLHAIVADPDRRIPEESSSSSWYHDEDDDSLPEVRDELDRHRAENVHDVHTFFLSHPGVEDSPVGKYLKSISPVNKLYNDPFKNMSREQVDHIIRHEPNERVRESLLGMSHITEDQIEHVIKNDPSDRVRKAAIQNPNATVKNISTALKGDSSLAQTALSNKLVNEDHLTEALNHVAGSVQHAAINHPKITEAHISQALANSEPYIKVMAIGKPKATEDHLTEALAGHDPSLSLAALKNPKITLDHLDSAMNSVYPEVRRAVLRHPKVTEKHLDMAMASNDSESKLLAVQHPKATENHINLGLNEPTTFQSHDVGGTALKHPNATLANLRNGYNSGDSSRQIIAVKHKNADEKLISDATRNPNQYVRCAAADAQNANESHLHTSLNDSNQRVRALAIYNKNANESHITKALSDPDEEIRFIAMRRPKFNDEHAKHVLTNGSHTDKIHLLTNVRNISPENAELASKDEHPKIRRFSLFHLDQAKLKSMALNDPDSSVRERASDLIQQGK